MSYFSLSPKSVSLLKQTSLGIYANAVPFIVSWKCQNSAASAELSLETEKQRALSYQKSPLSHGWGLEIAWKLIWLSGVSCGSLMLLSQYKEFIPINSFQGLWKYLCCVNSKRRWKKKGDLTNLQSKASWNNNKAAEMLKFVCFTEKGLEGFNFLWFSMPAFWAIFCFKSGSLICQLTF